MSRIPSVRLRASSLWAFSALVGLCACGGESASTADASAVADAAADAAVDAAVDAAADAAVELSFQVGGTITGLGVPLSLSLNGAEVIERNDDGAFTFTGPIVDGQNYQVQIAALQDGQECIVENGSGTAAGADITDVTVTCDSIVVNDTGDTTADDGKCSLREAVTAANTDTASGASQGECRAGSGADTIKLPTGTFILSSGNLVPASNITIAGRGSQLSRIDGNANAIISISTGTVTFQDLLVTNTAGVAVDGSAILILGSAEVRVFRSAFVSNNFGIQHIGTVPVLVEDTEFVLNNAPAIITSALAGGIVRRSTFESNAAGAVIHQGAADLRIENSTFTGNGGFGGLSNSGGSSTLLALDSVTVAGNTIGIRNQGLAATSVINSVIFGNSTQDITVTAGTVTSIGNNVIGSLLLGFTPNGSDNTTDDPLLAPLADNGGFTKTMALGAGSPAIDSIASGFLPTDQRGIARPQGGGGDVGAFEAVP